MAKTAKQLKNTSPHRSNSRPAVDHSAEWSALAFGMTGLVLIALAFFSMNAQAFDFDEPTKTPTPKTIRRDSTESESRSMISIYHDCQKKNGHETCSKSSGFFVRNSGSKIFAMVARHTFKYSIDEFCGNQSYRIYFLEKHRAQCKRVVTSSPDFDLAIIELNFGKANAKVIRSYNPLALTSAAETTGTEVKAIGYPGDELRNFRLTTSDHCWTGSDPFPLQELEDKSNLRWNSRHTTDSDLVLHNCQTFAGNSGGPLINKRTGEVFAVTNFFNSKTSLRMNPLEFVPGETLTRFLLSQERSLRTNGVSFRKAAAL